MALVSRIGNRRKSGSHKLSGQAEACETRALLSAAAIAVADAEVVDLVEASIESQGDESPIGDDELVTFEDCRTDGSEAEPLNPDEFTRFTLLIAPVPDGLVLTEDTSPDGRPFDGIDYPSAEGWYPAAPPEWWLKRQESVVSEVDGETTDESSSVEFGQLPYPEGWEPSWVMPPLDIVLLDSDAQPIPDAGEMIRSEWAIHQLIGGVAPEGWDPSWLFPDELTAVDGEIPEMMISEFRYPEDPSIGWANGPGGEDPVDGPVSEDGPVDGEVVEVPWEYLGPDGEVVRDDFDWHWVRRGPMDGTEGEVIIDDSIVLYAVDPLPWDESFSVGNEFIDVTDGSEFEIVDAETDGGSLYDGNEVLADGGEIPYGGSEPEIYFAMSFGAVVDSDRQRSVDEVELPSAPTPIFSSVAVRTTVLFDRKDTAAAVSALIAQSEEPVAIVSEPVPQSVSPVLRSKSRSLSAASATTESEELNSLTPLFENSAETIAPEVKPADPEELPSDETVTAIENDDVSDTEGYVATVRSTPVSGVVRVQNATRSGSVAIDQFMVQYAQNSFMS